MLGPRHLDLEVARIRPESIDSVKVETIEIEPHVEQLSDRPRSEPVAARFLARVHLLLHEVDIDTVSSEPVRGRRAPWAAANDKNS
ncbi:MAG: hypothetical protein U9Q71_06190 [Pseudomonadota bacterium]|nr:hypothetical protein [Pseudomonadota bacterium]